ncbi:MAG TPA: hypothetical protein PLZ51_00915, partial [Aggregatilineales bacterium]|nr:hypothetical protein [Aggregatilineales bacterium]
EDERRNIIAVTRRNAEEELTEVRKEIKRLREDMRRAGLPLETLMAVQQAAEKIAQYNAQPIVNVTEAVERPSFLPRLGDVVWLETLNAEGTVI